MKTFVWSSLILFAVSSLLQSGAASAQETGATYIERELDYLMKVWPGDYDNQEQISFDARAQFEQELGQGRFHAFVAPVSSTDLGKSLLYVEKSMDGDLKSIYEQRVYSLEPDEAQKAIRATAYRFSGSNDVSAQIRASKSPLKVKRSNLELLEGCDVLFRRDDMSFVGATLPGACNDAEHSGYLTRSIKVSEGLFSFNDARYLTQSSAPVTSTVTPRLMRKARWFACMVDVPKDTPMRSNHTQHYIKIHDQGGSFAFTHPDGREMALLMRNTWSYGMHRETFFIGVFEGGVDGKLLVYSWGAPGADRVGMNPGYIRIQCDLDTPENVRLQEGLREDS